MALCYSESLRPGRSVNWILVVMGFSAHVVTVPGAQPAAYAMGTGPVYEGNVHLTPNLNKIWGILLIPVCAFMAGYGVNLTFAFYRSESFENKVLMEEFLIMRQNYLRRVQYCILWKSVTDRVELVLLGTRNTCRRPADKLRSKEGMQT